ncbi:MAG: hypothetical protein Q8K89_13735 [Actinomycetota bacterium]|nr:hypothetical protein [Actinomycetota bacterium]
MTRILTRSALTIALLVSSFSIAGCSLLTGKSDLLTVSDPGGLFHVKTPADWSSHSQESFIAIYGSEDPPASDVLNDISLGIFTTKDTTDSPVPEALSYVVATRAQERSWTDADISEPADTEIGGRPGSVIEVTATDSQDVPFRAEYYFLRTSGQEVLVIAAAPAQMWDDSSKLIHTLITDEWYWHLSADQGESTPTAQ